MRPQRSSAPVDFAETSPAAHASDRDETALATIFYRELQHRTANLLHLAILQLDMQALRCAADLRPAFSAAAANLRHLATSQRHFDMPDWKRCADAATEVRESHAALAAAWATVRPDVRFDCSIDADAQFQMRPAGVLSLIVVELATNAYKHAFRGREGGTLTVTLQRSSRERACLSVVDDWPGFGAAPARVGLGMGIVEALAVAIGGELSIAGGGSVSTRVRVAFDIERC